MVHETGEYNLRDDTVEQIIKLLETKGLAINDFPTDRRLAVADTLRAQKPVREQSAVGLCGLPGAGKSLVAGKLADVYDTEVVTMGDAIRADFTEYNGRPPEDSDELGAHAAEWREADPEAIPEKVAEVAADTEQEIVVIDGVRSTTDYDVLLEYFDEFYLVEITAPFYTRLQRFQTRGREGEEDFDSVDLAERDTNELENLGVRDLLKKRHTRARIKNDGGKSELVISISDLVENNLPFRIENGKPLGLDDTLEKMRKAQQKRGVKS